MAVNMKILPSHLMKVVEPEGTTISKGTVSIHLIGYMNVLILTEDVTCMEQII